MKIIVAAALILCVAVQVFAEPITEDELDDAEDKCINYRTKEINYGCVFKLLKVKKGDEIDKNKLKELLNILQPELSDEEVQKLIEECADERGDDLSDCIVFAEPITQEEIDYARTECFMDDRTMVPDFHCVFKVLRIHKKNGEINYKKLKEFLNLYMPEVNDKRDQKVVIEKCAGKRGSSFTDCIILGRYK